MHHVAHELGFRLRPDELCRLVNDNLRDRVHIVLRGERGKLTRLDNVCAHLRARDRQYRGQPGRAWTVGSGRGDEHLDVRVALESSQEIRRFLRERGLALRDEDD